MGSGTIMEVRSVSMWRASITTTALLAAWTTSAAAQGIDQVDLDRTGPMATKLIILAVFLSITLFAMQRLRLPDIFRSALIWLVVMAGLVGVYAYRTPLESAGREMLSVLLPGRAITDGDRVVVRRAYGGQFVVRGNVDGAPIDFLFDTGASLVVLSAADAVRAGYDPATLDYRVPVMTAGGMTEVAPIRIGEIAVGGINMPRVRAAVARPGDLDTSLLGMTFLNRLTAYEVRRDRLVLTP